jgi:predicted anti-sigma-YlaC factor YlaD
MAYISLACERARTQVSLDLDGELSELERKMLDSHLAGCASCQAFSSGVTSFTHQLRAAPYEQMENRVDVRRPSRSIPARFQFGLAAAVAVALIGSVLQLGIPGLSRGSRPPQPTQFPTLEDGTDEMKQIISDGRAFQRRRGGDTSVL